MSFDLTRWSTTTMDSHRFDAFTRALTDRRTRRGALPLLGSLLAVPILSPNPAVGKKKKKKKVTLCYNNLTIKVAKKNRDKFLLAGAAPGACPSSPPPPPPPPSCETAGCPYYEVCQGGACVDCFQDFCTVDADCCSNLCSDSGGGNKICLCQAGTGPCTSNAQCCNGNCVPATGKCGCDPVGVPCLPDGSSCCSGICNQQGGCR